MRIQCPSCGRNTSEGRFCEKCGAELPGGMPVAASLPPVQSAAAPCAAVDERARTMRIERPQMPSTPPVRPSADPVRPIATPVEPNVPAAQMPSRAFGGECVLEIDKLCVLFEDIVCSVRFRFDPGRAGEGIQNLVFSFENQLTGEVVRPRPIRWIDRMREFAVTFPAQAAGTPGWYVTAEYECDGRKQRREGDMQFVVVRPQEAQKVAEQLAITITTNVNASQASDVRLNQKAAEDLSRIAKAENPFDELRRIVSGGARVWTKVDLFGAGDVAPLPAIPPGARTERVTLDLGVRRISFFASRTVTFGRTREKNDICLRPPKGMDVQSDVYAQISREHCYFEHRGDRIAVCDGRRDDAMVVHPSTCGTFCNNIRIIGAKELSVGESATLSFGGETCIGAVSLAAKACSPAKACESCPHADRRWCADGCRPSLALTRRDGIPEMFVALWSCFPLGEADPSFDGVVVFRKDGGFAWRRGRRSGWLVPGAALDTDYGKVTIS